MVILLDNGHGSDTAGKRSPDGRLREYKYAREIAAAVMERLVKEGFDARRIVTEENDISLQERVKRVNAVCNKYGAKNVLLVSVHCDAAGADGKWHQARGWSAWTSRGQTQGDVLADCLYAAAKVYLQDYMRTFPSDTKQRPIREDYSDGDADWEAGFYILRKSLCAACLTENLFQDSIKDVDFLLSKEGRESIVRLHVDGIKRYLEKVKK